MIISRLTGGLGNQMFQYAMGRRAAHYARTTLKLDISWFGNIDVSDTIRSYDLDCFNIQATIATKAEIRLYRDNKILRLYNRFRPYYKKTLIKDYHVFDPKFLNIGKHAYVVGDWQSEDYFSDIADILRSEFTLKKPFSPSTQEYSRAIRNTSSVSLHVRRGDYISNPKYKKVYTVLDEQYYARALEYITTHISKPEVFVFSDDLTWVKKHMHFDYPVHYVGHHEISDPEELLLMSQCKHNIIANSSFSWWGAWLNPNPDTCVIAPRQWYTNQQSTEQLIPSGWTIL